MRLCAEQTPETHLVQLLQVPRHNGEVSRRLPHVLHPLHKEAVHHLRDRYSDTLASFKNPLHLSHVTEDAGKVTTISQAGRLLRFVDSGGGDGSTRG